jgi:transcription termination/antitermination protein NusG
MKNWYVVQLASGNEQKVKNEIERRVIEFGVESDFGQVLIPTSGAEDNALDNEKEEDSKLFPGYILVSFESSEKILHMISSIDRVVRFLGGNPPVPLTEDEYSRIVNKKKEKSCVQYTSEHTFDLGGEIDITKGPFSGFVGTVQTIDESKKRLTVVVSIFGRLTPIEVSFDQVSVLR